MLERNDCPFIPVFVIDHISKPFDAENKKAVGKIFSEFYNTVSKDDMQIIMFDDENCNALDIKPDQYSNLVSSEKTGFNPFYRKT